jgi:hypothetical protein
MKKQKWMMLGIVALVSSALVVPGAFAKEKEDAYVAPAFSFTQAAPATSAAPIVPAVDVTGKTTNNDSNPFFAPHQSEDSKK